MWMHNGNIGGWHYIKRPLADSLADRWYLGVKGGTDSEWAFALFLDLMEKEGVDPSAAPEEGFDPGLLRKVMEKIIRKINELIAGIPESCGVPDLETRSLLNFAVTDGHTVLCTRYVSSKRDEAASLYFSSGTKWTEGETKGHFKMERHDKGADIVLVASEPLTFERRMAPIFCPMCSTFTPNVTVGQLIGKHR
jgi:glutamine amidotransferase